MKFLMLLRKELRESLPWLLLAGIAVFVIGVFLLRAEAQLDRTQWTYSRLKPGMTVESHWLLTYSVLTGPAVWLLCVSPALGLVLAVVQFWVPGFTKTWPFLLHRSADRVTILGAKLTAAFAGFVLSLGAAWIILYAYGSRPGVFPIPVPAKIFANGCVYILLGLLAYLGTALTGLSRARWYTTKIFGLVFVVLIFPLACSFTLFWACVIIMLGIVILLAQVSNTFLKREY
ncbi:MAG: hypothetical protein ACYS8Z_16910 [Planctomycetota bacterium]|jgi:hypothetical protein